MNAISIEVGERVCLGLDQENRGPVLGSLLSINHRFYIAALLAVGYTLGDLEVDGVRVTGVFSEGGPFAD